MFWLAGVAFLRCAMCSVVCQSQKAFALARGPGVHAMRRRKVVEQRVAASEQCRPRSRTEVDILQVSDATLADGVEFADAAGWRRR